MNAPVQVFGVILDYTVFLVLGYFPFLVFETKALRFPSKTCSGTSCVEVQAVYVYGQRSKSTAQLKLNFKKKLCVKLGPFQTQH